MAEVDHAAFEQDFSDYYDKALAPPRAAEVEAHLAGCDRCKEEYERFLDTMRSISGLHKMAAPQHFEKQVEETIHRRSAGRFFGRRAFGDRVPFELLAVLGLALGVAVWVLVRYR
jgi:anti-sigma factor RsiW